MTLPRFDFTNRAAPFLEVGIGDTRVGGNAARWDVQRWDAADALWSGTEPTWQDVTCEAFEVQVVEGRVRSVDRFEVGTMTFSASNVSGWADLVPPGPGDINTLMLRPGRSIRFGVDHVAFGRVVLFRGFIDTVSPNYDPAGGETVTVDCIDALGEVGRGRLALQAAAPAGQTAAARLDLLLDLAQWPEGKRRLDGSSVALLGVDINGQVADELGQTSDSAGGSIFGDTEANLAYRAMDWQMYPAGRPPDATIGNVDDGDVCPTGWSRPFARADMSNRVILGNVRDPVPDVVQLDDPASWGLYGIEAFSRTDLATDSPAVLTSMANRYLQVRGADTIPRIHTVRLDARTEPAAVDVLTHASPYTPSRYRCRLQLDRGLIFDELHFVTGVSHTVNPAEWSCELNLDLAAVYEATSAPRWEPASGADAGQARWDRVAWN